MLRSRLVVGAALRNRARPAPSGSSTLSSRRLTCASPSPLRASSSIPTRKVHLQRLKAPSLAALRPTTTTNTGILNSPKNRRLFSSNVEAANASAADSSQMDGAYVERKTATLILQDGTELTGYSFGADTSISGEVVFNTGMVGYPEALTDPSYRGQILVMTYPLVGNYGVPAATPDALGLPELLESGRIQPAAVIVAQYSENYSHWLAAQSLEQWLVEHGVPAITGVDTRALTQLIRDKGSMLGKVVVEGSNPADVPLKDPNLDNLVQEVSCKVHTTYSNGRGDVKILAVDCGMKHSITRQLVDKGADVTVVPWDADIVSLLPNYDGLFLSNGPGDPQRADVTIANLKRVLDGEAGPTKPIFGICLGHQLLATAAGGSTYKLPFGHRGHNQPAVDVNTGRCYITSQNHGYAVNDQTLPAEWRPYFVNANDQSSEGIAHASKPFFSVQFHPEANGGPEDTAFLFDRFLDTVRSSNAELAKSAAKAASSSATSGSESEDVHAAILEASATGRLSVGEALAQGLSIRTCLEGQEIDAPLSVLSPRQARRVRERPPKKVLLLGSGGLSIGQAGEFDYSGSQALKALKEEGIYTVLVNPNIATVQTAKGLADKVYFLPVTAEVVEGIIEKEKPDGILLQFGGQTALNTGVQLDRSGVLARYGVQVLGTSVDTIVATEDRDEFAAKLTEIDEPMAISQAAESTQAALFAAEQIGYPVIVRAAFSLGGLGSGFADSPAQLRELCDKALAVSPQVLIERSMRGWKEVEYEVVRDLDDNCITVCNMENFDPLGVHTGDSIVVAPSQTLDNHEYHMLRTAAIRIVRHLGVVGECNVQYALHPTSRQYCVIEVNPRLSRSSALASKATGYPLAFVAAKIALGHSLPELTNKVTGVTSACFEPSLDYCVVKIPRWDLGKFPGCKRKLGSAMKSVGEVMAVGCTFEETFQKALRMVDGSCQGYAPRPQDAEGVALLSQEELDSGLDNATDQRVWLLQEAMQRGYSVEQLHQITRIDRWFLHALYSIHRTGNDLKSMKPQQGHFPEALLRRAKRQGFSDEQIARYLPPDLMFSGHSLKADDVRALRLSLGLAPVVKQIDTLAAEYPAQTNYLYTTYAGTQHDLSYEQQQPAAVVLGAGAYCIGNSVEFDYTAVSAIRTLRALGMPTATINYNPETVSTDYDESDRLYFEELSLERVLDICELEQTPGAVVSVGGQIPNNLALKLDKAGVPLLGTSAYDIDRAEDRGKFSALCDSIGVDQPEWAALTDADSAFRFAERVSYPVLVRPSYVLSGAAMRVVHSREHLQTVLDQAALVSKEHPVVVSQFIEGCNEIEMDGVAQAGEVFLHAIHEHIEQAGVHSGDASLLMPPQQLSTYAQKLVEEAGRKVVRALNISGPFNAQFIVDDTTDTPTVKIIECNVRASRSFPFVSKVLGVDFIQQAARVFLGLPPSLTDSDLDIMRMDFVGAKVPNFSFLRLPGADPILGVEMASTGEVACFGRDAHEAFLKAMLSATNFRLPRKRVLVSSGQKHMGVLPKLVQPLLEMGYEVLATPASAAALHAAGINKVITVGTSSNESQSAVPSAKDMLGRESIDFCINLDHSGSHTMGAGSHVGDEGDARALRRAAVDFGIPVVVNPQVALMLVESLQHVQTFEVKHADEYAHALPAHLETSAASVQSADVSEPAEAWALAQSQAQVAE